MLVQRVRTLGRQSPQPRADIFAARSLQVIRVRNFHQVRWPPVQIFRLDDVITLNRFHGRANWKLARRETLANFRLRFVFAASENERRTEHCRVERDRKQCTGNDQIQFLRGHEVEFYAKAGKDK